MTPKEKAQELIEKYCQVLFENNRFVSLTKPKECAKIAVDEILNCVVYVSNQDAVWLKKEETSDYWQSVKKEIENL